MIKKSSLFLLVIIMITMLAGCKNNDTDHKKNLKIGITMYDEYDPFTNTIASSVQNTIYELGKAEDTTVICDIAYSNKSQMKQNDQVSEYIRKGYDVICVNLADRTDAMQIIDMAKNANVPIVFFNRELVKEDLARWDKLYYVGAHPEQSGELQGQLVINALNDRNRIDKLDFNHDGKIQYVMLEGEAGHQDALIRTKVSVETIENAGYEMEKLGDESCNWNREQASTKMAGLLAGHPWQIELVLANDDNIALGALDALQNFGVPILPIIVGVNGDAEVLKNIEDNKIEGTVYNDAFTKGETIGRMAFSLAKEMTIPSDIQLIDDKYVYVSYKMIDKSNVESFLEKATY